MNVQPYLFAYALAVSSIFLFGQNPDYQKNLEQAWSKPVSKSFYEPLQREVPIGTWTVSASIDPDYVGEPVYFHLEGSYRNKGGAFLYREVILSLSQQTALLQTAHPEWSGEEISRHLVFAQLQFQDAQKLPLEGVAFMKSLQETQGSVLPIPPGQIYLHPTTYSVRSHSGGSQPIEYSTIGWRGTPSQLEAELQSGLKEEPLVVLLNRLRKSYLSKWKEGLRKEGYSSLLDQMDQAALGMAIFEWACWENELPLAEKILGRGLSPDKPSIDGSLPLIAACGTGNRPFIQRLLDAGASLNAKDAQGRTPLTTACGTGDDELVDWLIGLGAKVEFPATSDPVNPILIAVNQSNLRLVQSVFRAAGPIPDQIKLASEVDLLISVVDPTVASWLLYQGCKPSPTALGFASRSGSIAIMKLYLNAGVDPNSQISFGSPLISAVEGGSIEAVELLLSKGADPTRVIPQRFPATALDLAIQIGNKAIVKALEKAKVSHK
ncbi:MAG: hypothetical protein H6P99_2803 [Holophagaceae bacterium]|nr:hypothetical protein [Holophagaceae bacterium]